MDNSNVTPLHPKEKNQKEEASLVSSLSPREIVSELDRFVVGQDKAKRAVAVALRNRWRRQALKAEMKNEVIHKNILIDEGVRLSKKFGADNSYKFITATLEKILESN